MTGAVPEPVQVIRDLRDRALTMSPAELGFLPSLAHPMVFGVVMDTGFHEALVTLVSFVDGTTSLYFGDGGGIIGAGEHEPVRRATRALLSRAELDFGQLDAVEGFPLPAVGEVRFYLRTYAGIRSAMAVEATLGTGTHALSPLFMAAHDVITAVREHTDSKDP